RAPRTNLRRDRSKLLFGIFLCLLLLFCGGVGSGSDRRFLVGGLWFRGDRIRLLGYSNDWPFNRGLPLLLGWRRLFKLQLGRCRGTGRLFVTWNLFPVPAGNHRAHVV